MFLLQLSEIKIIIWYEMYLNTFVLEVTSLYSASQIYACNSCYLSSQFPSSVSYSLLTFLCSLPILQTSFLCSRHPFHQIYSSDCILCMLLLIRFISIVLILWLNSCMLGLFCVLILLEHGPCQEPFRIQLFHKLLTNSFYQKYLLGLKLE